MARDDEDSAPQRHHRVAPKLRRRVVAGRAVSAADGPIGPSLIADIGATNARFALIGTDGKISRVRALACEDYARIEDAIGAYLSEAQAGEPTEPDAPRDGAFAVASPITGDQVALTNHPWSFSIAELRQRFALDRLVIINDFTANALAIPHLAATDLAQIGGGHALDGAPVGVIGPGSGLGVGALIPVRGEWIAVPSEGGHVTMAPVGARERAVLDHMQRHFDHVSAERVLSGPGLVNLYNTLAEIDGVPASPYTPAQIADPQIGAREALCREALEMFCAMLGTIAGNLALTLGGRGGIYIAGGIVPRLGVAFTTSGFRRRFEDKGRFAAYLAAIPTFVITHPHPAFLGLQRLLRSAGATNR
ncbi:MAG: glucokinase [Alphaproteobacteria bacterium]|nr:glucokinase [Alphaproteobacteria bacterium]